MEYHNNTAYIGKSGLDLIARSPAHYWARYLDPNRVRKPDTPAQAFGSLVHAAILEPHKVEKLYVVAPDLNKNSNAYKDWKATHAGLLIVDADDMQTALQMRDAVMSNARARQLLELGGITEEPIYARDPETGVLVKIKPDRYIPSHRIILDLKTTTDARPHAFAKSVAEYRYHVQDAFYTDVAAWAGDAVDWFFFIALEKEPPYGVAVYQLDSDATDKGRALYRENLNTYAACLRNNDWHAYKQGDEDLVLSLPKWAL